MDLAKFLIQAKTNTYASNGESPPSLKATARQDPPSLKVTAWQREKILSDGSKEFEFEEKGFRYRDRYFGHDPFMGEEIVWHDDEVVWGMNYYGALLSDEISSREVYEFLKKAMRRVTKERPFRGPDNFKEGDFEYVDKSYGDINMFRGTEMILFKGQEVYRLYYHGGGL